MHDLPAQCGHDRDALFLVEPAHVQRKDALTLEEFGAMADAFSPTGGLLEADELAVRIALGNGVGTVARWIVERRAVTLYWQNRYWLPAFQFTRPAMRLCESLDAVLDELVPVMDDWYLAAWFVTGNLLLQGLTPASALAHSPCDVLDAARACRFAVRG